MKYKARKLLSLFLAFVMVCGMIPAALASGNTGDGGTGGTEQGGGTGGTGGGTEPTTPTGIDHEDSHTLTYTKGDNGQHTVKCSTENCKFEEKTENCTYTKSEQVTQAATCSAEGKKTLTCECGNTKEEKIPKLNHTWGNWTPSTTDTTKHTRTCSECQTSESEAHKSFTYTYQDSTYHVKTCGVCKYAVTEKHTLNSATGKCSACQYDSTAIEVSITKNRIGSTYDYNDAVELTANVSVTKGGVEMSASEYDVTYSWSGDCEEKSRDESSAWLDTSLAEADAYCKVTVKVNGKTEETEELSWSAKMDSQIDVEAVVYNTNPGYALGDPDDEGGDSIVDQIVDAIDDLTRKLDDTYTLSYVEFDDDENKDCTLDVETSGKRSKYYYDDEDEDDLSAVTFTPDEDFEGKATFSFSATCTYGKRDEKEETFYGTITFDVKEGAKGVGILYTAEKSENVELDPDDFENFWSEEYAKGELEYVVFESVTGGTLYDNYAGGKKNWTDVEEDETKCYLEPSKRQTGLDDLTFVPSKRTTTTATIRFTATGTTGRSSSRTTDMSGTITILYLDGEVRDIVCTSRNSDGSVTMDPADFLDVYRDAMGTNKSTTLSIQFLKVPTYGTLYYKYDTDRSGKISKSTVELKSSNIANYTFSTGKTGKRLDDVTYVPGRSALNDSVTYACYVGGTLKYIGTVTFGLEKVELKCTASAAGVTFKASDFFTGNLLTCQYITFGVPSSGALYQNGNVRVSTYDKFGYTASATQGISAIGTVSYMPVSGYNGVVEIPFTAVTYSGGSISGTMRVTVVSKTFSDVPVTHWSYPYISRLAAEGVVSGITATTFGPNNKVEYGAALKMILLATGYPKQSENTSGNWASNYLNLAYNSGIVSSKNVDLTKAITRIEMAEIAAKALKLSSASRVNAGISGPTDTTNGYVYALYNAKIVGGDTSTGKNLYRGDSSLTREEMAKIVCNVGDYYKSK